MCSIYHQLALSRANGTAAQLERTIHTPSPNLCVHQLNREGGTRRVVRMDDEGEEADRFWVAMGKLCVSILLEAWAWKIDDQVNKEGLSRI